MDHNVRDCRNEFPALGPSHKINQNIQQLFGAKGIFYPEQLPNVLIRINIQQAQFALSAAGVTGR